MMSETCLLFFKVAQAQWAAKTLKGLALMGYRQSFEEPLAGLLAAAVNNGCLREIYH